MKSKIMLRLLPDDRYLAEASKEEPVWIGYYPSTPHYIPLDSTDATPAGFYDMVKLKYELTLTSSRYQNNKEDEQETRRFVLNEDTASRFSDLQQKINSVR